jgi:AraC-like DNA-binding protein
VLQPTDPFYFSTENKCSVLATSIFLEPLEAYAHRLAQSDDIRNLETARHLGRSSPDGLNLQRALVKTWTSLLAAAHDVRSALVFKELEDELLARFVLVTDLELGKYESKPTPSPAYLHTAEEYLCANLESPVTRHPSPVTRDRLAETAGVSIRTLSRAFMKRHGIGPMAFLKQRRFEATYRELLGANQGESLSTTPAH